MSDIFISYKREEQPVARKLAIALESEGWTVWWDPKLRAGEHFDDVIEEALNEAKCVVVLWSELSVKSEYVRDEATFALGRYNLIPVTIENVKLPFRFKGVQTLSLLGWDGSKAFPEFRRLVDTIAAIASSPGIEARRKAQSQRPKAVYDVFISFKNLDEKGVPTPDAELANEVYNFLTSARGLASSSAP
jgi:hypothetical protein